MPTGEVPFFVLCRQGTPDAIPSPRYDVYFPGEVSLVTCSLHRRSLVSALFVLCSIAAVSSSARAELYLSLEARESYDDNVIGLTADNRVGTSGAASGGVSTHHTAQALTETLVSTPGQTGMSTGAHGSGMGGTVTAGEERGDFSTNLYANIGYDWEIGSDTRPFVQGTVDHTSFSTYSEFNFTIATVSAGVSRRLSDIVSIRASGYGSVKDYDNDLRDGTAYGAGVTLRERFSPSWWARQRYEIEQNDADSPFYRYFGQSLGITLGWDMTIGSTFSAGYTVFLRDYIESSPPVTVTSQIASLGWAAALDDAWSFLAGYDHEWSDSDIPGTAITNNRYTAGIRYEY
jgi:hypothetical protein